MAELLLALIPLGIGGALVPVQIIITLLLLQSASGRITAVAWLAGMTVVRLLQGVLFGLILGVGAASSEGPGRASWLALLVVAIAFYVMAVRKWLKQPDDDAPPPAWVERVGSVTPSRAFLLGAGLLVLSVKQWVFTLAAIAAIAEAESLGQTGVDRRLPVVRGPGSKRQPRGRHRRLRHARACRCGFRSPVRRVGALRPTDPHRGRPRLWYLVPAEQPARAGHSLTV